MKPRCVRKTQAHTVLLSPKLANTPKIVAMKSWGGLWEGDQSYQHLLELGHHKSWDQHHGDSCKPSFSQVYVAVQLCPQVRAVCSACGLHAGFLPAGNCAPDRLQLTPKLSTGNLQPLSGLDSLWFVRQLDTGKSTIITSHDLVLAFLSLPTP